MHFYRDILAVIKPLTESMTFQIEAMLYDQYKIPPEDEFIAR